MSRRAHVVLCVLSVPCVLVASCAGGSETGNPAVPTRIGLQLRSSDPNTVAISSGAQGTVIDEAWVAFGQIAFLPRGECGTLDSYPHMGPTLIAADLAADDVSIELDVAADVYCGAVAPLEQHSEDLRGAAPSELSDHSIVVRGHRDDGVAFLLAFPEQDELELQAITKTGTFEVTEETRLLLAFDVAVWMRDVELAGAKLEADGSIRIDATHNLPLLLQFEANIDCSLELYEDTNGSGRLESGDLRIAACPPN